MRKTAVQGATAIDILAANYIVATAEGGFALNLIRIGVETSCTMQAMHVRFLVPVLLLATACTGQITDDLNRPGPDKDKSDTFAPPSDHPYLVLAHLDEADPTSAEFTRLKQIVEDAMAGDDIYGYSGIEPVHVFHVTQDERYIRHAIELVDKKVRAEEERIGNGSAPEVARDSYLYVGQTIQELSLVYDYGYDLLTSEQRERWSAYAEQSVWNVWNYEDATWGGKAHPWSGWSVTNPGSNYHHSFLNATLHWAVADERSEWIDFLRNNKLPPLLSYYEDLAGGGSREGTSYGTSLRYLFGFFRVWQVSLGEAITPDHCQETIDYWIHATLPTMDHFAPIGDQSRISEPVLFDYHEQLVAEAVYLNRNNSAAERGTWWLNNNSIMPMQEEFNARHDLLPRNDSETAPTQLSYHAQGAGHLFARTSWSPDADWLAVVAGVFDEDHAHQDQGSFTLFQNDWLAVTENIWSGSGIHQGTDVHNILRFESDGSVIPQRRGNRASMTSTTEGTTTTVTAQLAPVYEEGVEAWQRVIEFGPSRARVQDTCRVANGVQAIWQINVPVAPRISGSEIKAGALTIRPIAPQDPEIRIVDWSNASGEFRSGWKVEIAGSGCGYDVELTW